MIDHRSFCVCVIFLCRSPSVRLLFRVRLTQLAFSVEDAFGRAMDIEGVVLENDVLAVIQARPQV